ncbi:hypothetical protein FRC07_006686 [Ceratobasidium sp. 392]|nr:hypothetical protein FRC07_006686 [Ceratobasidium sp. 392]
MSRSFKASGSSSKPLIRQRSTHKSSKNAKSTVTTMPTRVGLMEGLTRPQPESDATLPFEQPTTALDDQDWVDEEPDDPPSVKNSPNRYLREWLQDFAETYLPLLFARDALPPASLCSSCQQSCDKFYKCRTCLSPCALCAPCLLARHQHTPTHFVQNWNGKFWVNASLADLGMVLHLGHNGAPCPQTGSTVLVLVGDLHGFANVNVAFCDCPKHASRSSQLLAAGFMACSDHLPQSAFTLSMLDHLSVFTTAGKCSGFKYWTVLKRLTNTGFPGKVSDRYRELLQTLRKYNYLISRKRSGVLFSPHPLEKDPADQGLPCVACPRPTYNFDPAEITDPLELEFFRFWASLDGNFRNPRKDKKVDPDDISLTDGQAYFPTHENYLKFLSNLKDHGHGKDTTSDCSNHKATKNQFVKFLGLDVSGLGAVTCARHSFFMCRAVVDFFKGERYAYGDYAVASFIQYITREGPLKIGLTYDIWCQWYKNLLDRAKSLPPGLKFPEWLDLVGGIPKFHLMGHKQACYDRFSLNYMQYVGRIEGEGCERAWAYLNETAGSTSEMSPGFRHDTINYLMADWNYTKMIGMGVFLASKYKDALKGYHFQRTEFARIDVCVSNDNRKEWAKLPLTAKEGPKGVWTSVFSTPSSNGKLQELARNKQEKESKSARTPAKKPGVTQWLIMGIELESEKKRLKEQREKITSLSTRRQKESFDDKCKALNGRIILFREGREKYMGYCEEPNHPDIRPSSGSNPEDAELGLPSSYSPDTLEQTGLAKLAELESAVRRADCNDTLDRVRDLLGAKALTLKFKNQNIRGEVRTTRAESALRDHTEKIHKEQWRYNNSRAALIRLGATTEDLAVYQYLEDKHLKYLKDISQVESRALGQGKAQVPSWIWLGRSEIFKNEDKWLAQTMKVEWFRARERFKRWEEELKLLKREMVMSYRSFKTYESIWKFKADSCANNVPVTPGMSEYAYARSNFFRQLADGVMDTCLTHIKDDTVIFAWCKDWLSRAFPETSTDQMEICVHKTTMANPWEGLEESLFGMSADEVCRTDEEQVRRLLEARKPRVANQTSGEGQVPREVAVGQSVDVAFPIATTPLRHMRSTSYQSAASFVGLAELTTAQYSTQNAINSQLLVSSMSNLSSPPTASPAPTTSSCEQSPGSIGGTPRTSPRWSRTATGGTDAISAVGGAGMWAAGQLKPQTPAPRIRSKVNPFQGASSPGSQVVVLIPSRASPRQRPDTKNNGS